MSKKSKNAIIKSAKWTGNFISQLIDHLEKLEISLDDIYKLGESSKEAEELIDLCAKKIAEEISQNRINLLDIIHNIEPTIISRCNGSKNIIHSTNLFGDISPFFQEWNLIDKETKTKATAVNIYEMKMKNGNFTDIYGSLNRDIDSLCLTQHQIIKFVEEHSFWIRRNAFGTFFLFKTTKKLKNSKHNLFIARIESRPSGGHCIKPYQFDDQTIWIGANQPQFVIPA